MHARTHAKGVVRRRLTAGKLVLLQYSVAAAMCLSSVVVGSTAVPSFLSPEIWPLTTVTGAGDAAAVAAAVPCPRTYA
jgi:hypothetical protein